MTTKKDGPNDREKKYHLRTRLIHGLSHSKRWDYDHHVVPPMTVSATFRLDSAKRGAQGFAEFAGADELTPSHHPIYIYDRLGEPTGGMLEDNLATAEGGEMALCFASGMAAISAAICSLAKSEQHIVAHKVLYGCTFSLIENWLPRIRIESSLVDLTDANALRSAIKPNTRVVYFETPVNPDMVLIDIAEVRRIVDQINARRDPKDRVWIVVDNTFATPYCQRPLELGADLVCQSLTKAIGGFGTDIGGALIGPKSLYHDLILYRKDFGGILSPKNAWNTLVYGLPTLAARMVNYQKSAMRVAEFLQQHPKVKEVHYPGLKSFPQYELAQRQMCDYRGHFAPGSMIYFVIKDTKGDGDAAEHFIDWAATNAYTLTLAVSLGQIKTLIEAPYSMTHSSMCDADKRARGIVPGGIRLSIGLEDWHDIIADLDAALEHA
ncbi:MAG: PLP-dependent transferase [Planctomycetes bacterium]|nr:PLP-dependent transferase [Planctomycetota bacterium]MBI3833869.1 PLP-dependent transferase [Planctomycetota bacterium]